MSIYVEAGGISLSFKGRLRRNMNRGNGNEETASDATTPLPRDLKKSI